MIAWIGGALVVLASTMFYAASPNQKLLTAIPPRRALAWGGGALFLLGALLIGRWAGPATTVFIALTLAMFVWSVVPLGIAWRRGAPGGKA